MSDHTTHGVPFPTDADLMEDLPAAIQALAGWIENSLYGPVTIPALLNGWGASNSGEGPRYRVVAGVVYLGGRISGGVIGQPAFVMPAALRPEIDLYFTVTQSSGGAPNNVARVQVVAATGNVVVDVGANTFVSLANVRWPVKL